MCGSSQPKASTSRRQCLRLRYCTANVWKHTEDSRYKPIKIGTDEHGEHLGCLRPGKLKNRVFEPSSTYLIQLRRGHCTRMYLTLHQLPELGRVWHHRRDNVDMASCSRTKTDSEQIMAATEGVALHRTKRI